MDERTAIYRHARAFEPTRGHRFALLWVHACRAEMFRGLEKPKRNCEISEAQQEVPATLSGMRCKDHVQWRAMTHSTTMYVEIQWTIVLRLWIVACVCCFMRFSKVDLLSSAAFRAIAWNKACNLMHSHTAPAAAGYECPLWWHYVTPSCANRTCVVSTGSTCTMCFRDFPCHILFGCKGTICPQPKRVYIT